MTPNGRPLRIVAPPPQLQCPIPTLKPGSDQVASLCGAFTDDMFCSACWGRVSRPTRREFNQERNRLRREGILQPSPLMRDLIKRVIMEAAART